MAGGEVLAGGLQHDDANVVDLIFQGTKGEKIEIQIPEGARQGQQHAGKKVSFQGVIPNIEHLYRWYRKQGDSRQGMEEHLKKVMVEYDCPEAHLDAACAITPGIESPTVAPLSKPGWVAVKAMTRRRDTNRIMDALEDLGAKGIIITDIRTCRI